jgi:FkbM family methyltransferase
MTSARELFKQSLPAPVRRAVRFLSRLPVHYRADMSYQICADRNLAHGTLAISDAVQIVLPNHAVANSVFRSMAFESRMREESTAFLELAKGCERFVDVGASGGFFSALFARSRYRSAILSVDFDRASLNVLEDTRARNGHANSAWIIDPRGIGEGPATVEVVSSGYGGAVSTDKDEAETRDFARSNQTSFDRYQVRVDRLATICADHKFVPDLLKVDIEGFEHEMIDSSLEFLADLKPRMAFELHVAKLRARGKSPEELVAKLAALGYKLAPSGRPLDEMFKKIDGDGCARATMAVF